MIEKKMKVKILKPKFDDELYIIELSRKNIVDENLFSFGIISDCLIENHEAKGMTFKQVIFKKVIFNKITFSHIDLVDVRF